MDGSETRSPQINAEERYTTPCASQAVSETHCLLSHQLCMQSQTRSFYGLGVCLMTALDVVMLH